MTRRRLHGQPLFRRGAGPVPAGLPGPDALEVGPRTLDVVEVELDDTPVVYLGEGAQLGYLPEPVRHQLGW